MPGVCAVRIPRVPVDDLVSALLIARLGKSDARDLLTPDLPYDQLDKEVEAIALRREELADLVAGGLLPASVARPRLEKINVRLAEIEALRGPGPVTAEELADPGEAWRAWTIVQRRAVLRVLLEHVTVRHGTVHNGPRADLSRVSISWQQPQSAID